MRALVVLLAVILLPSCRDPAAAAGARDRIRITGSSTVFPFTALVAERYAASRPGTEPPVVESTGTGAGARQFCAGVGAAYADILDASRRLRPAEWRACAAHGVTALMELGIGLDGIAFAQGSTAAPIRLTGSDIYRAISAAPGDRPNAARLWRDVDPALPATPIRIFGPPATSGSRDVLIDLFVARGCRAAHAVSRGCATIRTDGPYIDAGESDALTVRKLAADPEAIGIFGHGYLAANADRLRAIPIDGALPSAAAIAAGRYPGARPLYLYVKTQHLAAVPGLRAFLDLYRAMWGPGGPLVQRGLIAAPPAVLARSAQTLATRRALDPATL